MTAYYNEFDPKAAAWLRELIRQGHIAPGDVDERSIEDVTPADLAGYAQCHFFAGIGVWSYALRRAGWPDDRPVWTGSCPCQPFSAAGKGGGFDDERHLWPHFHYLVDQCRPHVVLGEQVASKDGLAWFDLVQADLEGAGYASGAVDFCSAGVGAPHIRQRLYWFGERLADADDARSQGRAGVPERADQRAAGSRRVAGELADTPEFGRLGRRAGEAGVEPGTLERPARLRDASGVDDAPGARHERAIGDAEGNSRDEARLRLSGSGRAEDARQPGPTNGFWGAADWLHCRNHKWRPVEPGTFPLAHGAPARVGRLRGYGNAVNAVAAQTFIEAYLDTKTVERVRLSVSEMPTDNNLTGVFE